MSLRVAPAIAIVKHSNASTVPHFEHISVALSARLKAGGLVYSSKHRGQMVALLNLLPPLGEYQFTLLSSHKNSITLSILLL
jgi:hypothetical protein